MVRPFVVIAALLAVAAAGLAPAYLNAPQSAARAQIPDGIHKIKHVIVIMQENRSFDEYFGTFPGADGIPMKDGVPTACVPDPNGPCVRPFHDPSDSNHEGPHAQISAVKDIDGGKMDGFVRTAEMGRRGCKDPTNPGCAEGGNQVMGYHTEAELPNYWYYARNYVLQDKMFEPVASWSLPAHLYMVSEWSAKCATIGDPSSCTSAPQVPDLPHDFGPQRRNLRLRQPGRPDYAWTDLTYLLHKAHVSWGYYIMGGTQPDSNDGSTVYAGIAQSAHTPGIWNVLPSFDTVKQDGEVGNVQDLSRFYAAAKNGTLPSVAWICPALKYSEHFPALVSNGQSYVSGLINAVMQGPDWDSTAIFVSWDDWGGFYDHVVPPKVDDFGYGLRVPGLVVSAYAKKSFIDHQVLSHDAYVKFIEDDFLTGARIDPKTDGRPDPRPGVRENDPQLGDLRADFDFAQAPRAPTILPNAIVVNQ
ncbi:MAG: alkaline phosphatase family protein [Candidatus Baltobacteraceae bacterium]